MPLRAGVEAQGYYNGHVSKAGKAASNMDKMADMSIKMAATMPFAQAPGVILSPCTGCRRLYV
jgi:hypothetical protein